MAVRLGITTEMASYFSAVLGVTGLLLLSCKDLSFIVSGIVVLHLFNLFDCVDGSIARVMKTENPYGKFLDSIIGDVINFFFFAFIGIMIYRHPSLTLTHFMFITFDKTCWVFLGGATAMVYILLHHLEGIYASQISMQWEIRKNVALSELGDSLREMPVSRGGEGLSHMMRLIDRNFRARETHYFFLVVALCAKMVDIFLVFFLIYFLFHFFLSLILFGRRALIMKIRIIRNI